MRKFAIITLIIITLLLSGCMPDEYTFPNKNQPVEKIELLYNPHANKGNIGGPMETICTLEEDSIVAFLERLYQLETAMCITPPPTGYGFYVAQVVYQNGDVELYGSRHIEFIEKGNKPTRIGEYYFSGDGFEELFCEYAGITSFEEDMELRETSSTRGQWDGSIVPSGTDDEP